VGLNGFMGLPNPLPSLISSKAVALSVDIVNFCLRNSKLHVLLVKRQHQPYRDMWAIPGGFLDDGESLEKAAYRLLQEEASLFDVHIEQLAVFGDLERDPRGRVISVTYLGVSPAGGSEPHAGEGVSEVKWCALDAVPPLAFDHAQILQTAVRRLRIKLEYTNIAFQFIAEEFTLSELQGAYEAILGERLEKRNFRRKILQADLLEETGRMHGGEGRPARVFRIKPMRVHETRTRRLFP